MRGRRRLWTWCVVLSVALAPGAVSLAQRRGGRSHSGGRQGSAGHTTSTSTSASTSGNATASDAGASTSTSTSTSTATTTATTSIAGLGGNTGSGSGEIVDRSERVVRATVAVLVGTEARARGVVVASDGRVITALAPLRGETNVTLRYPNGRTGAANVVATDAEWGLALVQPRAGAWGEGLSFAASARRGASVRWAVVVGDAQRSGAGQLVRRRSFVGPHSILQDAWELDPAPGEASLGSGITNADGELVAIVVPPDASVTSGGASAPFGAPAPVVQALLARAGNTARAWLGLVARDLRDDERAAAYVGAGIRVTDVTAGGPADRAGVRVAPTGDVIVAAAGNPVHHVADLAIALEGKHPGDALVISVMRQGIATDLTLQLGNYPPIGP